MSLRGDWKFLRQIGNLCRHYGCEHICFHCLASKGHHIPEYIFSDFSDDASWRSTVFDCEEPWDSAPALSFLRFWKTRKIGLDALHIWHLGVARDLWLSGLNHMFFVFCLVVCGVEENGVSSISLLLRIGGSMSKLVKTGYFGLMRGVGKRLEHATASLKSWCRANGVATALRKFSQDNLCLKKGIYPDTRCKWFSGVSKVLERCWAILLSDLCM